MTGKEVGKHRQIEISVQKDLGDVILVRTLSIRNDINTEVQKELTGIIAEKSNGKISFSSSTFDQVSLCHLPQQCHLLGLGSIPRSFPHGHKRAAALAALTH